MPETGGNVPSTLVIAEIASAHDGALSQALRLIDATAMAGADVAKAEYWSDPDRLADRRRVADRFREHYRRYAVPAAWLPLLKARCDERSIGFMCTTYVLEDIAVVAPFVERFKIAGFEVQDAAFVAAHQSLGKPILASVPLSALKPSYAGVRFLHCCQSYPTSVDDLNLAFIRRYGFDGFSDHSGLVDAGAAAVFAGARIIEAHLKLDDTDGENYDAGQHAHAPAQFAAYVSHIRRAERMMGAGDKATSFDCESEMRQYWVMA